MKTLFKRVRHLKFEILACIHSHQSKEVIVIFEILRFGYKIRYIIPVAMMHSCVG